MHQQMGSPVHTLPFPGMGHQNGTSCWILGLLRMSFSSPPCMLLKLPYFSTTRTLANLLTLPFYSFGMANHQHHVTYFPSTKATGFKPLNIELAGFWNHDPQEIIHQFDMVFTPECILALHTKFIALCMTWQIHTNPCGQQIDIVLST